MSDEIDIIPDFDFSLEGVDPGKNIAAPAVYQAKLRFKVEQNKEKTGRNMVVVATLLGEVFSQPNPADGSQKTLENHTITTYFPLQAKSGAKDPEGFKKNLAALVDACMGTDITTRPAQPNWNELQDVVVMVETEIEQTEKFGAQDRVKKFIYSPPAS